MKKVLTMVAVLSLVVSATAVARPLDGRVLQPSIQGDGLGGGQRVIIPVNSVYSTGFEGPAFAPGAVEPQEEWSSSFTNNTWSIISSVHPGSGSQHMRLQHNTQSVPVTTGTYLAKHGGTQNGVDVLLPGPNLTGAHSAAGDIAPFATNTTLSGGGLGYSLTAGHVYANALTAFTARMFFYDYDLDYDYDSDDIAAIDDPDCGGGAAPAFVVFTNGQWMAGDAGPGTYHSYRMDIDPTAACNAGQVKYYRDNVLIGTTNLPFVGSGNPADSNTVGGTRFVAANASTEVGDFDNMSLTPEPGSLALLGLGALALIRRRR